MVSHCSFDLHFSYTDVSILSCVFFICLWRNVYLDLLPIFRLCFLLLLGCMDCLCILEIRPLSFASLAKIFTHLVGYLFLFFFFLRFPLLCKSFRVYLGPTGLFCFYYYYFRRWVRQDVVAVCAKECCACVFL